MKKIIDIREEVRKEVEEMLKMDYPYIIVGDTKLDLPVTDDAIEMIVNIKTEIALKEEDKKRLSPYYNGQITKEAWLIIFYYYRLYAQNKHNTMISYAELCMNYIKMPAHNIRERMSNLKGYDHKRRKVPSNAAFIIREYILYPTSELANVVRYIVENKKLPK